MVSVPSGTSILWREPTAWILPRPINNTESGIGSLPVPSINRGPTRARSIFSFTLTVIAESLQEKSKQIKKNENKGFSHSFVLGLKESLKTDANIVVVTEADGTYSGGDLSKLLPYLENSDMVSGSRQTQILTEKGNQNSGFFVWANFILAKLIQMKYVSLEHMGIVNLTDVGCVYRIMKRESLEKIVDKLTHNGTDQPIGGVGIGLYFTMQCIENDQKIIEIPVTFKKRIGKSKISGVSTGKTIRVGLNFLWLILTV